MTDSVVWVAMTAADLWRHSGSMMLALQSKQRHLATLVLTGTESKKKHYRKGRLAESDDRNAMS